MNRSLRITLLAAVLVAVIVGTGALVASGSTGSKHPTLALRSTSFGRILVDSHGRTLYAFGHDLKNHSRCSGPCAMNWPPAASPAKPTVGKGISAAKLKVIRRADGSRQLSYAGHPLYHFIGDAKPGNTNGEGINAFGGTWHVVSKTGAIVTHPQTSSSGGSTGTSTTPAPNPYGY